MVCLTSQDCKIYCERLQQQSVTHQRRCSRRWPLHATHRKQGADGAPDKLADVGPAAKPTEFFEVKPEGKPPRAPLPRTSYRRPQRTAEELQALKLQRQLQREEQRRLEAEPGYGLKPDVRRPPVMLIDAYNVMRLDLELMQMSHIDWDLARGQLEDMVSVYAQAANLNCMLVYDAMGRKGGPTNDKKRIHEKVIVVYCRTQEADSFIIEKAMQYKKKGARQVLVVTNDNWIREGVTDFPDFVMSSMDSSLFLQTLRACAAGDTSAIIPYVPSSRTSHSFSPQAARAAERLQPQLKRPPPGTAAAAAAAAATAAAGRQGQEAAAGSGGLPALGQQLRDIVNEASSSDDEDVGDLLQHYGPYMSSISASSRTGPVVPTAEPHSGSTAHPPAAAAAADGGTATPTALPTTLPESFREGASPPSTDDLDSSSLQRLLSKADFEQGYQEMLQDIGLQ